MPGLLPTLACTLVAAAAALSGGSGGVTDAFAALLTGAGSRTRQRAGHRPLPLSSDGGKGDPPTAEAARAEADGHGHAPANSTEADAPHPHAVGLAATAPSAAQHLAAAAASDAHAPSKPATAVAARAGASAPSAHAAGPSTAAAPAAGANTTVPEAETALKLGGFAEVLVPEGRYTGLWVKCQILRRGAKPSTYDIRLVPAREGEPALGASGKEVLGVHGSWLRKAAQAATPAATAPSGLMRREAPQQSSSNLQIGSNTSARSGEQAEGSHEDASSDSGFASWQAPRGLEVVAPGVLAALVPIHCQWADWSDWGPCSETCGGGEQEAVREIRIFPQNGGDNCQGPSRKIQQCTPQMECPQALVQDCIWKEWGDWDVCTKSCGGGQQESFRQVAKYPQNGGRDCLGEMKRTRECNTHACQSQAVDCLWGPWAAWQPCTKSCGGGTQQSFRSVKVFPQYGGRNCDGQHWREQTCNDVACPSIAIDCAWGSWMDWGDCSKTCGGGVRDSLRQIFRFPQNGGEDCIGEMRRRAACGTKPCPDIRVDCEWGEWGVWTGCTVTCGGGTQQTSRMVEVYPQFGGRNCEGDRTLLQLCNTEPCPQTMVNCSWSAWSAFGECSASCGGGVQQAWRRVQVFPQNGGANCEGNVMKRQRCNTQMCPDKRIHCMWSQWAPWAPCSRTCGGGSQMGWRDVAVHPQNGGNECTGSSVRWQSCGADDCPNGASLIDGLQRRERILQAEAKLLQIPRDELTGMPLRGAAAAPRALSPLAALLSGAAGLLWAAAAGASA